MTHTPVPPLMRSEKLKKTEMDILKVSVPDSENSLFLFYCLKQNFPFNRSHIFVGGLIYGTLSHLWRLLRIF